uniref:LY6/PLAUR domain containing 1 n=1 Tax=Accipiter nisus TaxID=211598 RepID=A0A8B9NBY2_9AVES
MFWCGFFNVVTITIVSKILSVPGLGLQIQCYQCEEFQLNNDCSAPEFIVNCTVNVQDMCQKEVMEKSFVSWKAFEI